MTKREEHERNRQAIIERARRAFIEHPTWGDEALAEEYVVPVELIEDLRPLEYQRFRKAGKSS